MRCPRREAWRGGPDASRSLQPYSARVYSTLVGFALGCQSEQSKRAGRTCHGFLGVLRAGVLGLLPQRNVMGRPKRSCHTG